MWVRQSVLKRIEAALRDEIAVLQGRLNVEIKARQAADAARWVTEEVLVAAVEERDNARSAATQLLHTIECNHKNTAGDIKSAHVNWPWLRPETDPT